MKAAALALVLAASACTGLAQAEVELGPVEPAPAGHPVLLRVMTYNLHHGVDRNGAPTLREIAHLIADYRPDVVGLQEVDRRWSARSEFRDQAADLAAATGMQVTFYPTLTREENEAGYGLAVLTRHAPARQISGLYKQAKEPRGYLGVEFTAAGWPVTFVVTHLGLDAAERQAQIAELGAVLDTLAGPLILAGDFNCRPEEPAAKALAGVLQDALALSGRGETGTLLAGDGRPGSRIDFLFASPEFRVEDSLVPPVDYSDHRPIAAWLSFYLVDQPVE